MRLTPRSIVSAAILLAALLVAARRSAETATEQREAAVTRARAGHKAEAEAALRGMLAAGISPWSISTPTAAIASSHADASAGSLFFLRRELAPHQRRGEILPDVGDLLDVGAGEGLAAAADGEAAHAFVEEARGIALEHPDH